MSAGIDFDFDISHPACGAIGVCSKQAGYLNREAVLEAFEAAGIPKGLQPSKPRNNVALKRALKDLTKGDSSLRVESKGKGLTATYSIICTDKERIDLEEDNGIGIADAIASARIEVDGNGVHKVLVKPSHFDSAELLEKFNFHREHFKCSEDISTYISHKLLRSKEVQAVSRPGHGSGFYFVPKGAGSDIIRSVREVFEGLNSTTASGQLIEGVRISMLPMITTCADVVDILTDAVLDDAEKALDTLDAELTKNDEEGNLKMVALESKLKGIKVLKAKIAAFTKSCGDAFNDLDPQLQEIEARTQIAMLKVEY